MSDDKLQKRPKFRQIDEDILGATNSKIVKANSKKADLISISSVCEENTQKKDLKNIVLLELCFGKSKHVATKFKKKKKFVAMLLDFPKQSSNKTIFLKCHFKFTRLRRVNLKMSFIIVFTKIDQLKIVKKKN